MKTFVLESRIEFLHHFKGNKRRYERQAYNITNQLALEPIYIQASLL